MSALLLTRLASRCCPAPSTLAAALSTAPPRSPLSLPLLTAARHPPPAPPTTATILNRRLLRTSSIPSSLRSSLRSSSSRSISSLPESIAGVSICREWTPASTRVGALGMKCGMTQAWSAAGQRVPITMVELQDLQVVKRRTRLIDGVNALQLGGGWQKRKRLTLEAARAFEKRGLPYKRYLREFPVSEDAMLPVGATITARHFVPGQYVDAQGVTRGKGFAGVMKRWNFKGQPASHGHSLSHRSRGSSGGAAGSMHRTRVWKGMKMAGRMGGKHCTQRGLMVWKVVPKFNLLYIKGSIPGAKGSLVRLRDSTLHKQIFPAPPPFPTFLPGDDEADLDVAELLCPAALDPNVKANGKKTIAR